MLASNIFKLKAPAPTPKEELCQCKSIEKLYLSYQLSENPIVCFECRGEVIPERLPFAVKSPSKDYSETIEAIATWRSVRAALETLWLDAGAYEKWALKELLNPTGQVNREGLKLCQQITQQYITCYYAWFQDEDATQPKTHTCPCCHKNGKKKKHYFTLCTACGILF